MTDESASMIGVCARWQGLAKTVTELRADTRAGMLDAALHARMATLTRPRPARCPTRESEMLGVRLLVGGLDAVHVPASRVSARIRLRIPRVRASLPDAYPAAP